MQNKLKSLRSQEAALRARMAIVRWPVRDEDVARMDKTGNPPLPLPAPSLPNATPLLDPTLTSQALAVWNFLHNFR